jgi:flagellin
MGIRINTNIPALSALRSLRENDQHQSIALERLASGIKIRDASDDPLGLTISESLRSQMSRLKKAVENTKNAINLLSSSEQALAQVTELLISIRRSLLFALNGTASKAQLAAEQDAIDNAIMAIQRITETTKFTGLRLLDGSSGFIVSNASPNQLLEIKPFLIHLNPVAEATTFTLEVTNVARQAQALAGSSTSLTSLAADGEVTLSITGPLGTESVSLASGTTSGQLANIINQIRGFTGIYASGAYLVTQQYGSKATLRIEQIGGEGRFLGGDPSAPGFAGIGSIWFDRGQNAVAIFEGTPVSGDGNRLKLNTPIFTGEIMLNPPTNQDPQRGPGTTGIFNFTIRKSGLIFQLGPLAELPDQTTLGIPNMGPEGLGSTSVILGGKEIGGFLSSLASGGQNDVLTNPENGLEILSEAFYRVSQIRALLGSFIAEVARPLQNAQEIAIENITASESEIRDANFAQEVATLTRSQVLFRAAISVLAQTNMVPQTVLQLLQY